MAKIFHTAVDYSRTLEQMVAAGQYDYISTSITAEKFPVVGNGIKKFEIGIFEFNFPISSKDAIESIIRVKDWHWARDWYYPGKIEHLLSFGEEYPEEQRRGPIVALGSVAEVRGDCYAPILNHGNVGVRHLNLCKWASDWLSYYRFLAVHPADLW